MTVDVAAEPAGDGRRAAMGRESSPKVPKYLFDLLPGSIGSGRLTRTLIAMATPLSNVVIQFSEGSPPSPRELAADPTLAANIFISACPREPGFDVLLFVRTVSGDVCDRAVYIAVGLQCKWSSSVATTTLTLPVVETADGHFFQTMATRGWTLPRTLLVFLAHRNVASTTVCALTEDVPDGVAVAGVDCGRNVVGPNAQHNGRRVPRLSDHIIPMCPPTSSPPHFLSDAT
jgi:hypothetical protein